MVLARESHETKFTQLFVVQMRCSENAYVNPIDLMVVLPSLSIAMPLEDILFFVHVPKTAGTSFRVALERLFGEEKVARDYGANAPETTDFIRQHVHEEPDRDALRTALLDRDIKALSGHVHYSAYADIFRPEQTVAFLREPVQRLISEHAHHGRHGECAQELLAFAETPGQRDKQVAMLQGCDIAKMGGLGISERYDESLARICACFRLQIPNLVLNTRPERSRIGTPVEVDAEVREQLQALNAGDMSLYAQVLEHWDEGRIEPVEPAEPQIIAHVGGLRGGNVVGWLFDRNSSKSLECTVLVDGEEFGATVANVARPDLIRQGISHHLNVGLRLPAEGLSEAKSIGFVVNGELVAAREFDT